MPKSDPMVATLRPSDLQTDPVLDSLPEAAALFDESLRLLSANRAFQTLCHCEPGSPLERLLPGAPSVPSGAAPLDYLSKGSCGGLQVRLARGPRGVGVVVRPAPGGFPRTDDVLEEQERIQEALLALSREVTVVALEEELVASIARCIRRLLPERCFCIRIVDAKDHTLSSLYAEGPLLERARETIELRRGAAEKTHLGALPTGLVQLVEQEPRVFAGTERGVAVPLAASGQFFGILNLEYREGEEGDLARDERLLIQIANQAAIGVRNARLIDELTTVKRYLEELIENANALIVVTDRDRKVMVFNHALAQLACIDAREAIGRDILELLPEGPQATISDVFEKGLRGISVSAFELSIKSDLSPDMKLLFSAAPIRNAAGEVEAIVAIGQDLTPQKELERRVVQAEKLASLGQLAAGVVHEINNPLTTITMFADALLASAAQHGYEAGDKEKLQRIHESAERILRFARDLMSYAKPSTDRPEKLDVRAVFDQASRYCEHAVRQSKARLEGCFDVALPPILGVRANLVQVFVNLLTNACHALPPDGGSVQVSASPREGGLEIRIADTGQGIEEKVLAHIFEPFFTTKPEGRGTGLGLTIVQGIVEKHGGSISVQSTVGKGTVFTVWLPVSGEEQKRIA